MKLTTERARARIDQLTAPARELSMKEQDYLQALTLALLVLDAQEDATQYGSGFVSCINGEEPKKADPQRVVITFTNLGLGHAS